MTTVGGKSPTVVKTVYFPTENEVRLYLSKDIKNSVSLNSYKVTSTGIKSTDKKEVSLSQSVYFTPEEKCELYDISVANIWFKSGESTYYAQPKNGPCDVYVRIVNASGETKEATLKISAAGKNGTERVLKEEKIKLLSNEETTKGFKELSFFDGEKIDISLIK